MAAVSAAPAVLEEAGLAPEDSVASVADHSAVVVPADRGKEIVS
jgi:hypothetical protein